MSGDQTTSRHSSWFAVAAFSTVSLVALTSAIPDGVDLGDLTKEYKWSVSAASISVALAGLAWFAHMAKDRFVGTVTEGGLAFIVFVMWAGALPVIMKPENRIAIGGTFGGDNIGFAISNANLYFFSWAAFIMSFSLLVKYLSDVHGYGRPETSMWTALMASSFVVMAAASRMWKSGVDDFCDVFDDKPDQCARTKFAISIGAISFILCAVWVLIGHKLGNMVEGMMSLVMLAFWCFGVGYITFNSGPGTVIGNLFFSAWASFGLSVMLASESIHSMMGKFMGDEGNKEEEKKSDDAKDAEEDKDQMPDPEDTHEDMGDA